MASAKTTVLTFPIGPGLKEALWTVADPEHCSIANMGRVLIRGYCGQNGVTISEQAALAHET
jgi:hypothetical protein